MRRHARQRRFGREHEFLLSGEASDLPDYIILFGLVFGFTLRGALVDLGRVERCWDADYDVCGEELAAIICANGDAVFDFCLADFIYNGMDFEGEIYVFGGTVTH